MSSSDGASRAPVDNLASTTVSVAESLEKSATAGDAQNVNEGEKNLQKDEVTGEMVSKR